MGKVTPEELAHLEFMITADERAEIERQIRSCRGRWMVVDETGYVLRFRSKSEARRYVNHNRQFGVHAVVRRWRRDLVEYSIGWMGFIYVGKRTVMAASG